MAYYNLKIPVDCANEQEAVTLQNELSNFRLFNTKMVVGLMNLYKQKPALVKKVMAAASGGNIKSALMSILGGI